MTKLTLELPDDLAARLLDEASRRGLTPEAEARDSLVARYLPDAPGSEPRETVLERIKTRRNSMKPIPLSPEELKEWISLGRP